MDKISMIAFLTIPVVAAIAGHHYDKARIQALELQLNQFLPSAGDSQESYCRNLTPELWEETRNLINP